MYREFFRLSAKPFQLSPDVAFFYPSSEHRRALSFLEYGVDQADGFIVVTGAVGTGKSTLVQALLRDIDPQRIRVATIVTSRLAHDDLMLWVASRFGLDVTDRSKAMVMRELERFLIGETEAGRRVLLIVDESQNLPPEAVEELRMLSNFVLNGRPLMQIFLVGQGEFRETLMSPGFEQLKQRVIASYHLNPLSETETRTYIEHRLSLVGWDEDPLFATDAFHAIFEFTDGIPRRINNLCDRLLLFAYLEELHRIDGAHVRMVAEEIGDEFRPVVSDTARAVAASSAGAAVEVRNDGLEREVSAAAGISGSAGIPVTPSGAVSSQPSPRVGESSGSLSPIDMAGIVREAGTGSPNGLSSESAMAKDGTALPAETPLETLAKLMFDRATVERRLATLERGIDDLGQDLRPELAAIRQDLAGLRVLVEGLLRESRAGRSVKVS